MEIDKQNSSRQEIRANIDKYLALAKNGETNGPLIPYEIATCYHYGIGLTKDDKESFKWFQKAAEFDFYPAYISLGICYELGYGVEPNIIESHKWYEKAAHKGNAFAFYLLSRDYRLGRGVKKDLKKAQSWYEAAIDFGTEELKQFMIEQMKQEETPMFDLLK